MTSVGMQCQLKLEVFWLCGRCCPVLQLEKVIHEAQSAHIDLFYFQLHSVTWKPSTRADNIRHQVSLLCFNLWSTKNKNTLLFLETFRSLKQKRLNILTIYLFYLYMSIGEGLWKNKHEVSFSENLLSNVPLKLPQLQYVQNRAIPKPPFNRVFQGGTGRGTNASIQQLPKC